MLTDGRKMQDEMGGGYKCGSNGMCESGTVAVEEYSEVKSVMVDSSGLHRRTGVNESQTKKT